MHHLSHLSIVSTGLTGTERELEAKRENGKPPQPHLAGGEGCVPYLGHCNQLKGKDCNKDRADYGQQCAELFLVTQKGRQGCNDGVIGYSRFLLFHSHASLGGFFHSFSHYNTRFRRAQGVKKAAPAIHDRCKRHYSVSSASTTAKAPFTPAVIALLVTVAPEIG